MLSLPNELRFYVLELATHVPHLLDIIPNPKDPFPQDDTLDALTKDLHQSLPTRLALTLVSRTFNALATPLLYTCLLLTRTSVPRLCASFDASKAPMVRHVIVDIILNYRREVDLDPDVTYIFGLLHNVRILSIRGTLASTCHPPPSFRDCHLSVMQAMAHSLGPTLCKLVVDGYAVDLFFPDHLSIFTSSLVRLEGLISSNTRLPYHFEDEKFRILLPTSLPRLKYVNIDNAPFAFPAGIQPTHVHCPLNALPSVVSPALTYLSLVIPKGAVLDTFSSLISVSPSLCSLALSGPVTSILTNYPLPAISLLTLLAIQIEEATGGTEDEEPSAGVRWKAGEMRALVDALVALRSGSDVRLEVVRVLDDAFVRGLEYWATGGRVDLSALEECGFVVEDGEGRVLVDVAREIASWIAI